MWGSQLWLQPPFQAAITQTRKTPAESRRQAELPAPHFQAAGKNACPT
jgi:hypothetical protein